MSKASLLLLLAVGLWSCATAMRNPAGINGQLLQGGADKAYVRIEESASDAPRQIVASRERSGSRQLKQAPGPLLPAPGRLLGPGIPAPGDTALTPLPVEQRVIYRPTTGNVLDYIFHTYAGVINVAEADPMLAVNSAAVSTGLYNVYEVDYDYDQTITETVFGPSAKAVWASTAKARGIGGTKANLRGQATARGQFLRDLPNYNAIEAGPFAQAIAEGSLVSAINVNEDFTNPFLLQLPNLGYKGKK